MKDYTELAFRAGFIVAESKGGWRWSALWWVDDSRAAFENPELAWADICERYPNCKEAENAEQTTATD